MESRDSRGEAAAKARSPSLRRAFNRVLEGGTTARQIPQRLRKIQAALRRAGGDKARALRAERRALEKRLREHNEAVRRIEQARKDNERRRAEQRRALKQKKRDAERSAESPTVGQANQARADLIQAEAERIEGLQRALDEGAKRPTPRAALGREERARRERLAWRLPPQGEPGFREGLLRKIEEGGKFQRVKDRLERPGCDDAQSPFSYQELVGSVLHPLTGVSRFLCVWKTGAGKTLAMIKVLDNFFDDPSRPIVLLFPTESTVENFYKEMVRHPNRFCAHHGIGKAWPWTKARKALQARTKGVPPLKALRLTIAGGDTARKTAVPFKYRPAEFRDSANPYDGVVVVCDEAHNLLAGAYFRESRARAARYSEVEERFLPKVHRLTQWLRSQKGGVLVGMTATPIVRDPKRDGRALLDVIKGDAFAGKGDEGFVSYFNSFPPTMYHRPNRAEPFFEYVRLKRVPLQGSNAVQYLAKAKTLKTTLAKERYANVGVALSSAANEARAKAFPFFTATKVDAICQELLKRPGKSMVLVHQGAGGKTFRRLLGLMGCTDRACGPVRYLSKASGDEKALERFNRDPAGRPSVLVVDAKDYSEGVVQAGPVHGAREPPPTWGASSSASGASFGPATAPSTRSTFGCTSPRSRRRS